MPSIGDGSRHRVRGGGDDMSVSERVFEKDEELGKRDDDYKRHPRYVSWWTPFRWRKKRILVTVLFALAIFLLFQILPSDIRPSASFPRSSTSSNEDAGEDSDIRRDVNQKPMQPSGAPPSRHLDPTNPAAKYYYNEIIKFYKLGGSLHRISRTMGYRLNNHNVLFAASSLKSVSTLIPLACEMRRRGRNHVHFVLFGRNDLSVDEIQEINGVDKNSCDVFWHDARPDYAEYSTDIRAETGAVFAFKNINEFMHPQVLITDQLDLEDLFFERSVKRAVEHQGHPLIQIPKDSAEVLTWLTRLDSESLKAWNRVSIDILVHASPDSIGTLQRLVRSLSRADYTGFNPPRLILELPVDIDPMTKYFLDELRWPPKQHDVLAHSNSLIIRHRIPSKKMSAEEASVRFVESFYPSHPHDSHVLVVSPKAQLSPLYFQYLMYNTLEYRYSRYPSDGVLSLFGLSLDVPATQLDGSTRFVPPTAADLPSGNPNKQPNDIPTQFAWEAPNSGAALYFGDKWIEIQSFLTNRIDPRKKHIPKEKEVSVLYPAWMEYFIELMRARTYFMLYPGLSTDESLVTVHAESAHLSEEFLSRPAKPARKLKWRRGEVDAPDEADLEAFITPVTPPESSNERGASGDERPLITSPTRPLHQVLPFMADLPGLRVVPYYTSNGKMSTVANAERIGSAYAQHFRSAIGGCQSDPSFKKGMKRRVFRGSARDLFCWGDEDEQEWEPLEERKTPEGVLTAGEISGLRAPVVNQDDTIGERKADEKDATDSAEVTVGGSNA